MYDCVMRKNDDLAAWRLFFRVIELGSITRAADEANVEPSSVSRRISALEARVGAQLITRTARTIKLTPAGTQAYDKIRPLIQELDGETENLLAETPHLSGFIRLSAPVSFGDHDGLVQWLAAFQKQYPDVVIELLLSNAYVDLVEENIDLAIRVGRLSDERLIAQKLGDLHSIVCASPNYLAQHGTPQHPSELPHHRKVVYTGAIARGGVVLTRGQESFAVDVTGQLRINHLNAIHRAALAGAGIHLVAPLWHCAEDIDAGRLVRLFPDWSLLDSPVHLLRLSHRHTPQRVRILAQWLQTCWDAWSQRFSV